MSPKSSESSESLEERRSVGSVRLLDLTIEWNQFRFFLPSASMTEIHEEMWSALGAQLLAQYQSPTRHYHNLDHIADMLALLKELFEPGEKGVAVVLATWFHDVIYDSRKTDNEEQSVLFARDSLDALKVDQELVQEVARLVRLTTIRPTRKIEMVVSCWMPTCPS